jgi:hypothetical protein
VYFFNKRAKIVTKKIIGVEKMSIEKLIQLQIEFYNNQDLEGFASTYSDEISV